MLCNVSWVQQLIETDSRDTFQFVAMEQADPATMSAPRGLVFEEFARFSGSRVSRASTRSSFTGMWRGKARGFFLLLSSYSNGLGESSVTSAQYVPSFFENLWILIS